MLDVHFPAITSYQLVEAGRTNEKIFLFFSHCISQRPRISDRPGCLKWQVKVHSSEVTSTLFHGLKHSRYKYLNLHSQPCAGNFTRMMLVYQGEPSGRRVPDAVDRGERRLENVSNLSCLSMLSFPLSCQAIDTEDQHTKLHRHATPSQVRGRRFLSSAINYVRNKHRKEVSCSCPQEKLACLSRRPVLTRTPHTAHLRSSSGVLEDFISGWCDLWSSEPWLAENYTSTSTMKYEAESS